MGIVCALRVGAGTVGAADPTSVGVVVGGVTLGEAAWVAGEALALGCKLAFGSAPAVDPLSPHPARPQPSKTIRVSAVVRRAVRLGI